MRGFFVPARSASKSALFQKEFLFLGTLSQQDVIAMRETTEAAYDVAMLDGKR
jgi:hypothetical protein